MKFHSPIPGQGFHFQEDTYLWVLSFFSNELCEAPVYSPGPWMSSLSAQLSRISSGYGPSHRFPSEALVLEVPRIDSRDFLHAIEVLSHGT